MFSLQKLPVDDDDDEAIATPCDNQWTGSVYY